MGWKTLAIVSSAGLLAAASAPSVAWAATGFETGTFLVGLLALAAVISTGALWYAYRALTRRHADAEADFERQRTQQQSELATAEAAQAAALTEVETQARELRARTDERDRFGALLDAAPFAAWSRDADLKITWANRTYRQLIGVDAGDPNAGLDWEIASSIDPDQAIKLAARSRQSGQPERESRHFVVGGDRRALEIVETAITAGGLAGFAFDVTDLEESQADLARHIEAHGEVLENLATAIAIYGPDKRLMFYNRAYVNLWRLEEDFLDRAPLISAVLDRQREQRRLPEQIDFRAYKASRDALFTNVIEPQQDLVQLPDETMLRNVITPHPFGGLLFMFEDVTDALVLERARNTLIAVQRATLDNLYEGIAVFGSDARLKLCNSAYARIWQMDEEMLAGEPHVSEIVDHTLAQFNFNEGWKTRRDKIIAGATARESSSDRMYRPDGVVVDYAVVPLPDGQTLFTYLDVTDSLRIERALRERNEALEAADQLKSEFIASVSYELRTPLNTIIGFTEILKNQYFGTLNERQIEYVDDVLDSSQQLLNLINDILDLASIEAGHMVLERESLNLHATLSMMIGLATGRARKQNLNIELNCPPDIGWIDADERRIKQVIFHLVNNSIKFTPPGGVITVGAARENGDGGGGVAIWVSDTGVGIPEDEHHQVFERFHKIEQDSTRRGAGLGLSLVRSFIELHGGRVALQSIPGEGTKITCHLPEPRQMEVQEPPQAARVS